MKKTVKFGAFTATLTQLGKGQHAGSWKITYRDADGTMRTGGVFKDETKAKNRAMEILEDLSADDIELAQDEIRLIQRLRESKVRAEQLFPTLDELGAVRALTVADGVKAFLSREVDGQGYSYEQGKDYKRVLDALAGEFGAMQLAAVSLARLEAWADKWDGGAKRWNNKRTILLSFWRWAVGRNHAAKNIAESLPRKRVPRKSTHEVLTPKEFAILLVNCSEVYLPWLALSGFAGLRGVGRISGMPLPASETVADGPAASCTLSTPSGAASAASMGVKVGNSRSVSVER